MAIFPNVYMSMVMISSMGIISMSISYCPYALLGQYHEIKEVRWHKFRIEKKKRSDLSGSVCDVGVSARWADLSISVYTWH